VGAAVEASDNEPGPERPARAGEIELSCNLLPNPATVEHIVAAEALGYRRAWLCDSPGVYDDVWMTLARAADRTERIGLGIAVLVPSLRHVLTTARALATLEQQAPGRVAVAVGTGFTGRILLGQRPLPWTAVAAHVRALRGLLAGDEVEVDGRLLRVSFAHDEAPRRPSTAAVLVAANGPKGIAVAHELGDGVLCMQEPVPGFDWCAVVGGGTVLDPGEDVTSPRVFATLAPTLAFTYHWLWETGGAAVDVLPGGAGWRAEIEAVAPERRHLVVHARHLVAPTDPELPFISPELAAASPFTGTPAEVRDRVAAMVAGGATELVYAPMGADTLRELRAMAAAVIS
jgi:5,10-methylenetetrahydromethanopterin reductase